MHAITNVNRHRHNFQMPDRYGWKPAQLADDGLTQQLSLAFGVQFKQESIIHSGLFSLNFQPRTRLFPDGF
jgi:hypothetical protein